MHLCKRCAAKTAVILEVGTLKVYRDESSIGLREYAN